jgi:hypothetical protein
MMRFKRFASAAWLLLLPTVHSVASPEASYEFGTPRYSGDGCAPGTLSSALSPDRTSVSVLLDGFNPRAGAEHPDSSEVFCRILIPLSWPESMRLKRLAVDYAGAVSLPDQGEGWLEITQVLGPTQARLSRAWTGPLEGGFEESVELSSSGCGGQTELELDLKLGLRANALRELTLAALDSIDSGGPGPGRARFRARVDLIPCP